MTLVLLFWERRVKDAICLKSGRAGSGRDLNLFKLSIKQPEPSQSTIFYICDYSYQTLSKWSQ